MSLIKGVNLGHGEISTVEDLDRMTAAGANASRHVGRWDGLYDSGFKRDIRLDGADHNVDPEAAARLLWQTQAARERGHTIFYGQDSNNLQGTRGLGFYDLWNQTTTEAQRRRAEFIRVGCFFARLLKPDYMEPIVEPQGPYVTREGLWAYQNQFMHDVINKTKYRGKFLIGPAQGYQPGYMPGVCDPAWLRSDSEVFGRVALTCNVYDSLIADRARFEERLGTVLRVRDQTGLQVIVNQLWTDAANDPDGEGMAFAIRRLQAEDIGSLIWTMCTAFEGGPGLSHLRKCDDPNSEHVLHEARMAAVAQAWSEAA